MPWYELIIRRPGLPDQRYVTDDLKELELIQNKHRCEAATIRRTQKQESTT